MSFPTVDELRAMSLAQVRLMDIKNSDQEKLVQQVVDEKTSRVPEYKDIHVKNVDIKTKLHSDALCKKGHVCEEYWQNELDAKRSQARGQKVAQTFNNLETASVAKENDLMPPQAPADLTSLVKGKVSLTGAIPVQYIPELSEGQPELKTVPLYACPEHGKQFKNEKALRMHMTVSHK